MAYWLDKETILRVSNHLRIKGKKVVFTHGSFDLFHIGHLGFLGESKKKGDILIVGVDSDERVKLYKDKGRPIFPQEQRVEIISGLKEVDFAFIIEDKEKPGENYFLDLYQRIDPNIVTFGRSFPFKEWFENRKNYLKRTGYLEISRQFSPDLSTTAIFEKIRKTDYSR